MLGAFLLTAAVLKFNQLRVEPTAADPLLSSPFVQILAVQWELLLGLWLFSGYAAALARYAALATFAAFAATSLYLALDGQKSCHCFGATTVNPWLTFAADIVACAALLVFRPANAIDHRQLRQTILKGALIASAVVLVAVGLGTAIFGSPTNALAALRGERLSVSPWTAEVGTGSAGEGREFEVELRTRTDRPVRVIGGSNDCARHTHGSLPVPINPGESARLIVAVALRGSPGRFVNRYELYTDDGQQQLIVARYAGRIVPAPE